MDPWRVSCKLLFPRSHRTCSRSADGAQLQRVAKLAKFQPSLWLEEIHHVAAIEPAQQLAFWPFAAAEPEQLTSLAAGGLALEVKEADEKREVKTASVAQNTFASFDKKKGKKKKKVAWQDEILKTVAATQAAPEMPEAAGFALSADNLMDITADAQGELEQRAGLAMDTNADYVSSWELNADVQMLP